MISTKPMAVVSILALAGPTIAQEQVDDERIAELIEQLELEDDAPKWFWHTPTDLLVQTGRPALPGLMRLLAGALDDRDAAKAEAVLWVLDAMGSDSVDAWPFLRDLMRTISPEHIPSLWRTLSELGPYNDDLNYLELNQLDFVAVSRTVHRPHLAIQGLYVTRMDKRSLDRTIIKELDTTTAKLLEALEHGGVFEAGLAAELLTRKEVDAEVSLPVMRRVMLANKEFWFQTGPQEFFDGNRRPPPLMAKRELLRKLADAMLNLAPDDHRTAVAHGFVLTRHADPARRESSALTIGSFGSEGANAAPFLRRTLKDKDMRVVTSSITALGMIGPAAEDSIYSLEGLTNHEDPQITERAKAALRQIRGR